MLTCAIDAKEGRRVAIPGTFLHADMDQDVHMILEGEIAELIVKLETSLYRKYIWKNKQGKPILDEQFRPCTEHYKQLCCFGNCYQRHSWNGDLSSMSMTPV